MGYVPHHQEEKERPGKETWRKRKEWEQKHEERERAVQVVHYCDLNGNLQTWTGAAGELPPARLRQLFSPSYSPSRITNPNQNQFFTSNLELSEVPGMLKKRLSVR